MTIKSRKSSFSRKYILALSLIAIFSIFAFYNFFNIIDAQKYDAEIINMSEQQKMLSQKIALLSLKYKTKKLEENIELMYISHKKLLSLKMSEKIHLIYFSKPMLLNERVISYLKEARNFARTREIKSLNYILENSQELLNVLDAAVSLYQKEAEQRIKNMHTLELFILILILLTLTFEAIFIFRPVDKSVKEYTKELILEKEYSDMITQANTNAIIAVDEHFKIQTFNKSAQDMFKYSELDMIGTTLLDDRIIPSKYLKSHISGLQNFMQRGELKNKDIVFELEGQTRDKKLFPIRISFGIKVDDEKKIVVANIQNISSEKDKDELITQQSKLASMGEMIGNISHQWRQPLSAISTVATGVKLRHKNNMMDNEELYASLDKIKEYTMHLSNTIDDFKGFFLENKEDSLFHVQAVLNRSVSLMEATYRSNNISLNKQYHDKNVSLNGRESEFSQVILNILNNAKDILVEEKVKNKIVLIETYEEDEFIYINIFDNAGGISQDIKLKIFEPYFTTKHKSQGTGVGLFMSNKIIQKHFDGVLVASNQEFYVENKKYFGAKFSIKIKKA